jgi:hypothetical protein
MITPVDTRRTVIHLDKIVKKIISIDFCVNNAVGLGL